MRSFNLLAAIQRIIKMSQPFVQLCLAEWQTHYWFPIIQHLCQSSRAKTDIIQNLEILHKGSDLNNLLQKSYVNIIFYPQSCVKSVKLYPEMVVEADLGGCVNAMRWFTNVRSSAEE